MRSLSAIDRFQIFTTILLVVLGTLIIVRASILSAPWGSYVIGAVFLAYGLYRAQFIMRALRGNRNSR
jgi:hypothetical protein